MLSSNARTIRCFEIHKKEIAVVDQQISPSQIHCFEIHSHAVVDASNRSPN